MSTSRRGVDPSGFTVIELILAIAITAILGTCVYTVTQSMTATARRQKESSSQDLRRDRCEEIVRRDVRGWIPTKRGAAARPSKPASTADILSSVEFDTSADSLMGTLSPSSITSSRSTHVQYEVRKVADGYELHRTESADPETQTSLLLYRSSSEIRIEFFDGSKWVSAFTANERPNAVRFTLGAEAFVFRP
jgi:type II secretion system protein J